MRRSGRRLVLASALLAGIGGSLGATPAAAFDFGSFFGGSDDDDAEEETSYDAFGNEHSTAESRNDTDIIEAAQAQHAVDNLGGGNDDRDNNNDAIAFDAFGTEYETEEAAKAADIRAADLEAEALENKATIDWIRANLTEEPEVTVDEKTGATTTLWFTEDDWGLGSTIEPADPTKEPRVTVDQVVPGVLRSVVDYPNGDVVYDPGDGTRTILPAQGNRIVEDGAKRTVYRDTGQRDVTISGPDGKVTNFFDSDGDLVRRNVAVRQPDGSFEGSVTRFPKNEGEEIEKIDVIVVPLDSLDEIDVEPIDDEDGRSADGSSFDDIDNSSFVKVGTSRLLEGLRDASSANVGAIKVNNSANNTDAITFDAFGTKYKTEAAAQAADIRAADLEIDALANKAIIDNARANLNDEPQIIIEDQAEAKITLWTTNDGFLLESTIEPLNPDSELPTVFIDQVEPGVTRTLWDYPDGLVTYEPGDGTTTILPVGGNRVVTDGTSTTLYHSNGEREETIAGDDGRVTTYFDLHDNATRRTVTVRQPDGTFKDSEVILDNDNQSTPSDKTGANPEGDADDGSADSGNWSDDEATVGGAPPATLGAGSCTDTDGDGWGWTGTASCRVG